MFAFWLSGFFNVFSFLLWSTLVSLVDLPISYWFSVFIFKTMTFPFYICVCACFCGLFVWVLLKMLYSVRIYWLIASQKLFYRLTFAGAKEYAFPFIYDKEDIHNWTASMNVKYRDIFTKGFWKITNLGIIGKGRFMICVLHFLPVAHWCRKAVPVMCDAFNDKNLPCHNFLLERIYLLYLNCVTLKKFYNRWQDPWSSENSLANLVYELYNVNH